MLNKFRSLIRNYPILSILVFSGGLSLVLEATNRYTLAHVLLFISSSLAIIPSVKAMNRTLRHGFYGINFLQLTGLVFALLLRQYWTALVLALIICTEKPLLKLLQRKHQSDPKPGNTASFSSVNHAPFVRLLDRYSVSFTVLILLIAGAVWVVSADAGRFLEVVAIASTAPFLLTPIVTFRAGLNQAYRAGIIIKSATVFEKLANTQAVVLSKTGVLTNELSTVHDVKTYAGHTKEDVLRVATALASGSDHHLAKAIVTHSLNNKITRAKHTTEVTGMGISGRMRGENLHIGQLSFLEKLGVSIPANLAKPSKAIVYVAQADKLIGNITFDEALLPDAKNLITRLKKLQINYITLVSGGTEKAVATIAKQTGISSYQADCTASDKINLIDTVKRRPVVFVGDAHADAAALTAADVSICHNQENLSLCDVAIPDYTTDKLVLAFFISKRCLSRVRFVSLVGLFVVLSLVVASSGGIFTPLQSAGLQSAIVTLSVLGSTKQIKEHLKG